MNVRPLIIDDLVRRCLEGLAEHAEENPLTMDDLLDTYNKQKKPIGDDDMHVVELPFGYRVVYSIEEQPVGKVRHLSMSVNEDKKLPNMEAVKEIMKILGFRNDIQDCYVKLEDYAPNRQAINVLEKLQK